MKSSQSTFSALRILFTFCPHTNIILSISIINRKGVFLLVVVTYIWLSKCFLIAPVFKVVSAPLLSWQGSVTPCHQHLAFYIFCLLIWLSMIKKLLKLILQTVVTFYKSSQFFSLPHHDAKKTFSTDYLTADYSSDEINPCYNHFKF